MRFAQAASGGVHGGGGGAGKVSTAPKAGGFGGFPAGMLPPGMPGGAGSGFAGNVTPLQAKAQASATGAGGAGSFTPGAGMTNVAQKDPRVEAMQNNLASRYNQIKGKENTVDPFLQESVQNLRNRQSQDTSQRAMDQANAATQDQAAGLSSQMASAAARGGRGEGFGGNAITGAAQRLAAKQNAQIQMNELGRQDQLALQGHNILSAPSALQTAQSGQANQFLLGAAGLSDQSARLGLAQQGLGLEQWKAGNDAQYKQALLNKDTGQSQFDNYLKLMSLGGY